MHGPSEASVWLTSADGTLIALHDFGSQGAGEHPPMIVCHATGFHARTYLPLIETWKQHFHVFGLDVRGHGASQIDPSDEFIWDNFAEDLVAAIDHIGSPVRAFGHSMGGATILLAETMRPGSVERAWVFEPIIIPPLPDRQPSDMPDNARRRRAVFPSRAEALLRYASRAPLNRLRVDALASYVEYGFLDVDDRPDTGNPDTGNPSTSETDTGNPGTGVPEARGVRLACHPEHEAMTFERAGIPPERIAAVTMPVTVAAGFTIDRTTAADFAKPTADALPAGVLTEYPDLSHFGPLEQPDRIALDAAAFLLGSED